MNRIFLLASMALACVAAAGCGKEKAVPETPYEITHPIDEWAQGTWRRVSSLKSDLADELTWNVRQAGGQTMYYSTMTLATFRVRNHQHRINMRHGDDQDTIVIDRGKVTLVAYGHHTKPYTIGPDSVLAIDTVFRYQFFKGASPQAQERLVSGIRCFQWGQDSMVVFNYKPRYAPVRCFLVNDYQDWRTVSLFERCR